MTTSPLLTLDHVSYALPDGRTLFSDLDDVFDARPTGLVGRNGVGKTVLGRLLAGELMPTRGRCLRHGRVVRLSQQVADDPGGTVADLAGVGPALAALRRIEAGSVDAADFDLLADRWDLRERLQAELDRSGLGQLRAETPASALSGGECMRVALAGAWLAEADFLILDEPSNHLDAPQRHALAAQLARWRGGLLLISHDRSLLAGMQRIVELSPLELQSYGGGYGFYLRRQAEEQAAAQQRLDQARVERKRQERQMREQAERQQRRQARGEREGREANQARILISRQQERSEASTGRLRQLHAAARERLDAQVRAAQGALPDAAAIALHELPMANAAPRRVLALEGVVLPHLPAPRARIDLVLQGRQRVGLVGPNGCGKSTLLRVMAGQMQPLAGRCERPVPQAWLDQRLAQLDPQRSVLAQLQALQPRGDAGRLRMQLAQLGLDADRVARPSGQLSGGERLKAALACALYGDPPAQLLLLDEPSNHLDLPSLQALEAVLRAYPGALVVVSHDDSFLAQLGLTDRLTATAQGWRLDPWPADLGAALA